MKKICLFVFATVFIGLNVHAQDNGFGVRAGINITSITNMDAKAGFHVGGLYRLQLLSNTPFYFEPGLMLQFKGGKKTGDGQTVKTNLTYLEIPATFAYRFELNDKWAIQPALGLFFAYGIAGKSKTSSVGYTVENDVFGSNGIAKRGDMGLKIAVGALMHQIYFGIGYDASFINGLKHTQSEKAKNGSFYISAGYNF